MVTIKRTQKVLLAFACCLALVIVPISLSAQGGIIKKGAQGVQKGAEKTKEGVEKAGKETKEVVTGKDEDNDSNTQDTNINRQKSTETSPSTQSQSTTTTTESQSTSKESRRTEQGRSKRLPSTAGELPLLVLLGGLALAATGTMKAVRRLS